MIDLIIMSTNETDELFKLIRGLSIQVAKLEERLESQHRMTLLLFSGLAGLGAWAAIMVMVAKH